MNASGYTSYKLTDIESADQGKLILITYDFAIRCCRGAKEKMVENCVEECSKSLNKAQDAVTELLCSLNMKAGGEIARRLYGLYMYMNRRLVEANIKRDPTRVEEVLKLLTTLREAWTVAVAEQRKLRQKSDVPAGAGIAVVG